MILTTLRKVPKLAMMTTLGILAMTLKRSMRMRISLRSPLLGKLLSRRSP
jgi:hypothetical protein